MMEEGLHFLAIFLMILALFWRPLGSIWAGKIDENSGMSLERPFRDVWWRLWETFGGIWRLLGAQGGGVTSSMESWGPLLSLNKVKQ